MRSTLVAALLLAATHAAPATAAPAAAASVRGELIVFENDAVRFVLGADGRAAGLIVKPAGKELLRTPAGRFAYVRKAGKAYPATAAARREGGLRVTFGDSGVTADVAVEVRPRYLVFGLEALHGEGVEEVCLAQVTPAVTERRGGWLNVQWDDAFAVCLVGLSDTVCTGGMRALVYPEFGMVGRKAALVAAPTPHLMEIIRQVEVDQGLPSPTIGGRWAKRSPDVRRGYFFVDLTEATADEVIRYARLGEFAYVMTYSGTWSTSLGSYPIRQSSFPRGEASLKATIDKCHAAGLKVGMHMLTSFVAKHDPLVRPKPDGRLLKDAEATLAADVDARADAFRAAGPVDDFPAEPAYYGSARQGMTFVVDDEIVHYGAVGGPDGRTFVRCTRGYAGTVAAAHKAGAKIRHLAERYGSYLVDLRTSLKDDLADRIAGLVNRCGFDMIYFDGGECNSANGPHWYWVGQQQMAIYKRVERDLFVQGSGGTPWTWHIFARGCCDDFAAVAPKEYLDCHKIADSYRHYTNSFMPAELGWWGFLAYEPHHPATRPDEVEAYAARMMALDTPVSLETHVAALKQNGRTEEMLALLGRWERLRLGGSVGPAVRARMREGEWHLVEADGRPAFRPVRYDAYRLSAGGEAVVENRFGPQPLAFRLEAAPALAPVGDAANRVLLAAEKPALVPPPAEKAPMPGALAARVAFDRPADGQAGGFAPEAGVHSPAGAAGKPVDLLRHRALAVTLRVDGPAPAAGQPCAVLNVQLESTAKRYRDYYIDLDFTGERTVVLPEPTTARMLPEFRPAHANYAFKAAMYGYDYGKITALNLRWMRWPKTLAPACRVVRVEALAESEAVLKAPSFSVGRNRITVPADLKTGDYAEYRGDGPVRVFDRNGRTLETVTPTFAAADGAGKGAAEAGAPPTLAAGANRVGLEGQGAAPVTLTVITLGEVVRP